MHIQIIGQNLDVAFKELPIVAQKMYESKSEYQVWELSQSEYEKFGLVEDDDWKESYGWWRNNGCNQPPVFFNFTVNGNSMIGFKNKHSMYHDSSETDMTPPKFTSFSNWFEEYMGLSKSENLAFFANSLAEYNDLTVADFFKKFEG